MYIRIEENSFNVTLIQTSVYAHMNRWFKVIVYIHTVV